MTTSPLTKCQGCDQDEHEVQTYAAKFTRIGWELAHYCSECYALAAVNWNQETEAISSDPVLIALLRGAEVAALLREGWTMPSMISWITSISSSCGPTPRSKSS